MSFNNISAFIWTVHVRRKNDVSRSGGWYYGYNLRLHRKVFFLDTVFVLYAELS